MLCFWWWSLMQRTTFAVTAEAYRLAGYMSGVFMKEINDGFADGLRESEGVKSGRVIPFPRAR